MDDHFREFLCSVSVVASSVTRSVSTLLSYSVVPTTGKGRYNTIVSIVLL